jgi:hypothetical protein
MAHFMQIERILKRWVGILPLVLTIAFAVPTYGADCTLQTQIPAPQREELSNVARSLVSKVQGGDIAGLRNATLASVTASFDGIANSAQTLKPQIEQAGLTVDTLIGFAAAPGQQEGQGAQFFCGTADSSTTVVLSFPSLPPGQYALAIVHATGVSKPQQISLILAKTPENQWKLAGFFAKPMMLGGQNGLWYWSEARQYVQKGQNWPAWFYYQIAAFLVDPVDFLSSTNMDKLRQEAEKVRPQDLPGEKSWTVNATGDTFNVTRVDTSTALGSLDFDIDYAPSISQAAQLRDPVEARKQAIMLMTSVLSAHPGLRSAFHGLWVHANSGNASIFALELPMNEIPGGTTATASNVETLQPGK